MTISMAVTNIIRFGTIYKMEGMENADEDDEGMENEDEEQEGMENADEEQEGLEKTSSNDKKIALANSIKKIEEYAPVFHNFQEMMEGFKELTE